MLTLVTETCNGMQTIPQNTIRKGRVRGKNKKKEKKKGSNRNQFIVKGKKVGRKGPGQASKLLKKQEGSKKVTRELREASTEA